MSVATITIKAKAVKTVPVKAFSIKALLIKSIITMNRLRTLRRTVPARSTRCFRVKYLYSSDSRSGTQSSDAAGNCDYLFRQFHFYPIRLHSLPTRTTRSTVIIFASDWQMIVFFRERVILLVIRVERTPYRRLILLRK